MDPAEKQGEIFGRIIGVLAHEWHHYLCIDSGILTAHEQELAADKFAGKQLARLKVPPNFFADLLRVFPQNSSHPDGPLRATTVLDAWQAETDRIAREAKVHREATTALAAHVVVPVVVQAPARRIRDNAAKKSATIKSAAKTNQTSKKSAVKTNPATKRVVTRSAVTTGAVMKGSLTTNTPKTGAIKKGAVKKGAVKKGAVKKGAVK